MMGFLDKLLGREKKAEDMPAPAEPQPRSEGTMPEPGGMTEPPAAPPPGAAQEPGEISRPERETP
jgi:hypothetical protein